MSWSVLRKLYKADNSYTHNDIALIETDTKEVFN